MWRSILLLLFLPTGEALAYKPAQPRRHDAYSANGAFVLDVDPQAKRLTVFAAGKRDQPLWSFHQDVWQEQHFLSNDGKVVAIVTWRFVQVDELDDGICVEFWNETGKFREYSFAELCPHPARYFFEPGPVGSFWRKWYTVADGDGTTLLLRTTDEFAYLFAMDDGSILETTRIGLPWWLGWAFILLAVGAFAVLFVFWRRRVRKAAKASPSADSGSA